MELLVELNQVDAELRPQRIGDGLTDRTARIERGDRILEDHLQLAPEGAQFLLGRRRDLRTPVAQL
ncbi:hypothetical protein ACWGPK_32355, partial [Priestia megaterium]